MKPERLSLIVIMELIRLHGTGGIIDGMKTARALLTVGKTVENEFKSVVAKKSKIDLPTPRPHAANSTEGWFSKSGIASGHQRRQSYARFQSDHEDWVGEWSQGVRVKIGSFLVDALMNVATVDDTRTNRLTGEQETIKAPAFFHAYEYQKGHKLGVLKLHERITERLSKDPLDGTLHPRHLPMLVQPKPWIAYDKGGYLVNDATVMRFKESTEQLAYLARADRLGHCELVFSGLDVLGSTPWNVNRDVFNVVLETWNSGQRIGKMPPAEYDQPEPEKLPETDTDPHARNVYQQRLKAYQQLKAANHSDRCSVNYKIEIARAFLGDTFYFPHNLDFRGRAYPIPPHLNHIGDDLSRGLLLFADKKPLGERGLRWLKIHLSNLFGYDKASFDERVHFVHEHLEDIYDSAENPLTGRKWWQKADDPWQCLATCFELRNALESGNPLAFESRLPLHQDGTCNGLQHYAALGGDAQGAKQVNLAVTDRPSDVYTFVADMVEAEILRDLAKPNPPPQAAMLTGRVSRKVVKQTVMTTVYGVTYIGAREQIDKQLKNRGEIPEEETWGAASYLAKKVLACIGDLFKGAKGIQTYLNLVARVISKSIPPERLKETTKKLNNGVRSISSAQLAKEQMTSVIWTTPLGLPIVQPYRKTRRRQVMTKMQSVFISDPNMPSSVNSTKQASAFPPNFIHSLDATHMMLTALECRSQNLTFASVHDSYWTHASTIDDMNAIIRDTFIALHSSNVLERLDKEIRERYKGYKIAAATVSTGKINEVVGAYNAGVRAGRKPAADVADLVTVAADDMPSIEEGAIEVAVTTPVKDVVEGERLVAKAAAQQGMSAEELKAEAQIDVHETEDAAEEVGGKTAKGEVEVRTRFHDLALYLPELPNKGDFDVKTIQNSLYFFS
jgi:DNA-directed RNA polymerase